MSGGKLPPISFYTRRERTLMGLQLPQDVDLPRGTPKVPQGGTFYFHKTSNNAFLPDEGSKSNRKLSKSYLAAQENVHRKFNLSGKPQDISTIRLDDNKKTKISIQSGKLLYRNIPEGIALRKDDSKLVMKCKSPVKGKTIPHTAPTKYAQLHKLGLEETLTVNANVSPGETNIPSTQIRKETAEHSRDSEDKSVKNRNLTQTFRLEKKSDKTCVYPVQFKPTGLPDRSQCHHDKGKHPYIPTSDKDIGTPRSRVTGNISKSDNVSLAKVELGQQLNGVVSNTAKSKSENRDLYPIFDWNQQKKEDFMRVRFLDPVLRNFDENPNEAHSFTGKRLPYDHGKLFTRQSYDDIYRFVPDKLNIELDWKLINEYRKRVRKSSEGESRLRSPSFSPLLNPPPTAMEFNIADLETLLEQEIQRSSSKPATLSEVTETVHTNRSVSTDVPVNTGSDTGIPPINGVACKPISTALILSKKTKATETSRKHKMAPLPTTTVEESNECYVTSQTQKPGDNVSEIKSKQEEVEKYQDGVAILPDTSQLPNAVTRDEQPIQVVVKVIPSITEERVPDEEGENALGGSNEDNESVKGKANLPNKPSSAFLAVPRIDVSFEGLRPNTDPSPWQRKLPSPREGVTLTNKPETGTVECQEDVSTSRSQQNVSSRHHIPSKNIVFVSPAVQSGLMNA